MSRRRVFVKVSGDEYLNPAFREWIKEQCEIAWVVICVGGGTQINEEFARRGLPVKAHGPLGREMETFEERQLQRDILERNQETLQDWLASEDIYAAVEIPSISIGTVLCPVNGDLMVRAAYLGFDMLFVVTTPDRVLSKRSFFEDLSKVHIVAFERI